MTTVADLFSGAGGFSEAATMAGCSVIWAANHWPEAVATHALNHPNAQHACQNLQVQDWTQVPRMNLLLASSACQGHTHARGKDRPHHDEARSTAWAIKDAIAVCRPDAAIAENVPEFFNWWEYQDWCAQLKALGYSASPYVSDAADHGVPQHRLRAFVILTKSKHPIQLPPRPQRPRVPASSFVDFDAGRWSPIDKPGRSPNTLARIAAGRATHGKRFLTPYYGSGSGKTGRSLDRPIGTITTRARWALIDGDRMRMLTTDESRAGMGFRKSYLFPENPVLALHMMGNAVCPLQGKDYIDAVRAAI